MTDKLHIKKLPMPKFKRIEGNWRCTSDRRIYVIGSGVEEDDRYIGTATSGEDAIDLCNEHNKQNNPGDRKNADPAVTGQTDRRREA